MKRISIVSLLLLITFNLIAQSKENDFKPGGKPIVQVFATAFYDIEDSQYNFKFNRAHIGYQYQFSSNWSAKVIIDRGRATSVGDISFTDTDGTVLKLENSSEEGANYTMFLKFASLQFKVNDELTLEGGAILQNHYITQERFWGLRYVAQTFQDLYWKIPSSDLGFIAKYKLNDVISVDAAVTNGEGVRKVQDASGKVKFASGLDINPSKNIQTRVYYHNRQSSADRLSTEHLFSVFAGYKPTSILRLGGEFNYMANLDNTKNFNSYGFSFYSAYDISKQTEIFVRYDRLLYEIPNSLTANNKKDGNTIIGGISHSPVKRINISLNYKGWISSESTNENRVLLSMAYKF